MSRLPIRRAAAEASIELQGRPLGYLLKRSSARRTLALRVTEAGAVQVNAPLALPHGRIEAFLLRHAGWLIEQLARRTVAHTWQSGMELPYLGGVLHLDIHEGVEGQALCREGDRLCCPARLANPAVAVTAWYRRQAADLLGTRLAALCRGQGRIEPPWRLSNARSRWGSLSVKGVVGLSWRLIKASPAEIDYVICHELAHFRRRDHSAAFWREVERLCPGYATVRARLRENGHRYLQF